MVKILCVMTCLYAAMAMARPGHGPFRFPWDKAETASDDVAVRTGEPLPDKVVNAYQAYHRHEIPSSSPTIVPSAKFLASSPYKFAPPTTASIHRRQFGGILGGTMSSFLAAVAPAVSSALAPMQSAANTDLAGVSLVKALAPSVIPTADIIGPAQSAAAPVLENLLVNIVSAIQPLVSGAGSPASGVLDPVAALATPVESAIAAPVQSAIAPLVSAIAPAVVAALAPAGSALGSALGGAESSLVGPIESAVAPILAGVVSAAVGGVTGIEDPVASLLGPLLSVVDDGVLPLVSSAVSAVWPAIGPIVTPLNPVICALQPAEAPLGGNATALIPVQCVSVTSGNIVPVSTGVVTMTSSLGPEQITSGAATPMSSVADSNSVQAASAAASVTPPPPLTGAGSSTPLPPSQPTSLQSEATARAVSASQMVSLASSLRFSSIAQGTNIGPGAGQPSVTSALSNGLGNASLTSTSVSPSPNGPSQMTSVLSAVIPASAIAGSMLGSISSQQVMSCFMLPESSSTLVTRTLGSTGSSGTASSSLSGSPSQVLSGVPASASPAITPGPSDSQGGLILLAYGTNTITFSARPASGGGLVASFQGNIYALPSTGVAPTALARRQDSGVHAGSVGIESLAAAIAKILALPSPTSFGAGPTTSSSKVSSAVSAPTATGQGGSMISGAALQIDSCPDINGTMYLSRAGNAYEIVCNTNWIGRDIQPYLRADSFDECVGGCDSMDVGAKTRPCAAALYVPDAPSTAANCYLKYSVDNPTTNSTGGYTFQAAVLRSSGNVIDNGISDAHAKVNVNAAVALVPPGNVTGFNNTIGNGVHGTPGLSNLTASLTNSNASSLTSSATFGPNTIELTSPGSFGGLNGSNSAESSPSGMKQSSVSTVYASGTKIVTPALSSTLMLGPASNQPASQYISLPDSAANPTISPVPGGLLPRQDTNGLLAAAFNFSGGADAALADTPIDAATAVLPVNGTTEALLRNLTNTPHFSRDGGKGGMVGGMHAFAFADTGVYSTATDGSNGQLLGSASSSVARDVGLHGASGNGLVLQDGAGEFADSLGVVRGFLPLTIGESAYNSEASHAGLASRYAVWPESSFIPYTRNASIQVAPIVFSVVDNVTKASSFTYAGNALLRIAADPVAGPVAQRVVGRLFNASAVEWGCIGGMRSWGPSGVGGDDGYVYLFGNVQGGLLAARAAAENVSRVDAYQYWSGIDWSSAPPAADSTAYVLPGSFMDVDVFYSPRHLTFIAVYMNVYGDNSVYWRYLDAPAALLPPYAGGDPGADLVEAITKYQWSDEHLLFKQGPGLNGDYTYAAGVHLGYFGQDDVLNGGPRMLISWTAPTGQDPASVNSAYQIMNAVATWT